jgi:AcrR family transcriptional regulator
MGRQKKNEEAIRAAAISNFARKGFEGTGVRDIARDVGLTPAALYHYIGSKEDLLAQVMRDITNRLIGEAIAALEGVSSSPRDRLAALIGAHVRTHCESQMETQLSDSEIRSLTGDKRRSIIKLRNRYEDLWRAVIDDGAAVGDFNVVDPTVCRLALIQMCTGVTNWYSEDGPLSIDELVEIFVALGMQTVGMSMRVGEVLSLVMAKSEE